MLLDWYNDPAWTEPSPSAPGIREDSVENRVCLLGHLMQNWDEIGPVARQAGSAAEAIGSPLARPLGGVLPLESGIYGCLYSSLLAFRVMSFLTLPVVAS